MIRICYCFIFFIYSQLTFASLSDISSITERFNYNYISNLNYEMGSDIEEAMDSSVKNVKFIPESVKNQIEKYNLEAEIYYKEKNIDAAIRKYDEVYKIIERFNLKEERLKYYLNLIKINYYQNNTLELLQNLNISMLIALDLDDQERLIYIYTRLSYIYFEESDYFISRNFLKQAEELNLQLEYKGNLKEIYHNLYIISNKLGESSDANNYNNKYNEFSLLYPNYDIHKLEKDNEYRNMSLNLAEQYKDSNFIQADFVLFQVLNKITARVKQYKVRVGNSLDFENIKIIPRTCWKTPSNDIDDNQAIFEIIDNNSLLTIFKGWLFSSNTSLNSLEHPFYDIELRNCFVEDFK